MTTPDDDDEIGDPLRSDPATLEALLAQWHGLSQEIEKALRPPTEALAAAQHYIESLKPALQAVEEAQANFQRQLAEMEETTQVHESIKAAMATLSDFDQQIAWNHLASVSLRRRLEELGLI